MSDLQKVRDLIDEFVAGAADIENLVHALEIVDGLIGSTPVEEVTDGDAEEVSTDDDAVTADVVA